MKKPQLKILEILSTKEASINTEELPCSPRFCQTQSLSILYAYICGIYMEANLAKNYVLIVLVFVSQKKRHRTRDAKMYLLSIISLFHKVLHPKVSYSYNPVRLQDIFPRHIRFYQLDIFNNFFKSLLK